MAESATDPVIVNVVLQMMDTGVMGVGIYTRFKKNKIPYLR